MYLIEKTIRHNSKAVYSKKNNKITKVFSFRADIGGDML